MKDQDKTRAQLINELEEMHQSVAGLNDLEAGYKRAVEILEEREERYRSTFDTMLEGLQIIGRDWRYLYVNDAVARYLHRTKEELLGRTVMEVYPGCESMETYAVLKECMENRTLHYIEGEYNLPDGSKGWFSLRVQPVYEGICVLTFDITNRKKMELNIRKSETIKRAVMNATPDAIAIIDKNGLLLDINETMAGKFGKRPEELIGKCGWDLVPPELAGSRKKYFDKVFQTGQAQRFEDENRGVFYDNIVYPVFGEGGEITGVAVHARDITERKIAEVKLRESELKYRAIFEQADDSIALIDVETGKFVDFNDQAYQKLGYSREEFSRLLIYDIDPALRGHDTQENRNGMMKEGFTFEAQHWTKSGELRDVRVTSKGIHLGNSELSMCIWHDITKRKQAEKQILRQSRVLDAINRVLLETLTCESEEDVARTCLTVAEELTKSKFGWIGEINPDGRLNTIAISDLGWETCRIPRTESVRMLNNREIKGIWGKAIKDEQSVIIKDPSSHPNRVGTPENHPQITSYLGVPLKDRGKTIGMISLANKEESYSESDRQDIENLSVAFVEALKRKRGEEILRASREELRSLSGHLENIREEERASLARELHDTLGQALTALQIDVDLLADEIPSDREQLRHQVKEISGRLTQAIRTVQRISSGLRPAILDDLGFTAAVEWLAGDFHNRTGIGCELNIEAPELDMSAQDATACFRILQEALTNITRHSEATRVIISLGQKADNIILEIQDNGKGITEEQLNSPQSFGLIGMRERARLIGAQLKIMSGPTGGNTISLTLPQR